MGGEGGKQWVWWVKGPRSWEEEAEEEGSVLDVE